MQKKWNKVITGATDKSQLASWEQNFISLMDYLTSYIRPSGINLPTEELVVLDVGSGTMAYGRALQKWVEKKSKRSRLIALDGIYRDYPVPVYPDDLPQPRIEWFPRYIEDSLSELKRRMVEHIDLITMFNIPHRMSSIRSLGELSSRVPVVGSVEPQTESIDALLSTFTRPEYSASGQAYKDSTVLLLHNTPFSVYTLHQWMLFPFDPLFVAIPKEIEKDKIGSS